MLTLSQLMDDLRGALHPAPPCSKAACERAADILKHYSKNDISLPERLRQTSHPCYARHLVHKESEDGFCVVVMVWSPGQGTPVHDHGGVWCVESCVEGQLAITSYRMLDGSDPEHVRFKQEEYVEVGRGSVGCLIPPFEHHKIHNPFRTTAITIHVYGHELRNCTRYLKNSHDTFRVEKSSLSYSSTPAVC
ncbi:cysteine dioxygenase family protein [bacterium]|nr:cysteine dioxygenase family protein [bacterium]